MGGSGLALGHADGVSAEEEVRGEIWNGRMVNGNLGRR